MGKNKLPRKDLHQTDVFMRQLFSVLLTDFSATCPELRNEFTFSKISDFRCFSKSTYFLSNYAYFKRRYQLENLWKRYRFADDLYSDKELEDITNQKFLNTQSRIAIKKPLTYRSYLVLQRARSFIKRTLGMYVEEEHFEACKFGTRADVGVGAHDAYLDHKLSVPITGSRNHIEWFKQNYLPEDCILQDVIQKCSNEPVYTVCESLAVVNVPKTFKSLRSIMPNTRIGAFYTYGLGKVIEGRLRTVDLDIRKLQSYHQILAQRYSKSRSHVTADVTAASDSYVAELVNMLCPRKWYNALKRGRINSVVVNGIQYKLESFMTMGVGFTFPLQTLLFYSIIKSIMELTGIKGKLSVYGDDLIYPRKIHKYVCQIFTDLNFIINEDKTFVDENFRESCGGDYYCGIDVRPYQPEGSTSQLPPRRYGVLVYKTINGLLRRWDRSEIPATINFLEREAICCLGGLHQVPMHFPDTSGVKVDRPNWMLPWYQPWFKCTHDGNLSIRFRVLRETPWDRSVEYAYAYYWDHLRSAGLPPVELDDGVGLDPYAYFLRTGKKLDQPLKRWLFDLHESPREVLKWSKVGHKPEFYRSKITGKRLRKLFPSVALKMTPGRVQDHLVTVPNWTVTPRESGKQSIL